VTDKEQSLPLLEGGAPLLIVESIVDAERMKAELLLENPSLLLERLKMR
jgi:methionine synthase I (cobalamin-dependent)